LITEKCEWPNKALVLLLVVDERVARKKLPRHECPKSRASRTTILAPVSMMRRNRGNHVRKPLTRVRKSRNAPCEISVLAMRRIAMRRIAMRLIATCPIGKSEIAISAKVLMAKANSESREPMRIGKADMDRAVTTPACRVAVAVAVAAVPAEGMAISRSKDPRSADSAAATFNNMGSAAAGRAAAKWDRRSSRGARMCRGPMDKT
jgi:hypothetical protein